MKWVLILVVNATTINVNPAGMTAPAASVATATFETEEACWAAAKSFPLTMRNAGLHTASWGANCVPAGQPQK